MIPAIGLQDSFATVHSLQREGMEAVVLFVSVAIHCQSRHAPFADAMAAQPENRTA